MLIKNQHCMDPLTVLIVSTCMILLTSVVVNFYFVYLHTDFTISNFTMATQTNDIYTADAEIRTTKHAEGDHQECSTQTNLLV